MPDDLVTLETYSSLPEAEAALLLLRSHDIHAELWDAEIVNMDWMLGNAVGNIKLKVASSSVKLAAVVLLDWTTRRRGRGSDALEDIACLNCGFELTDDDDACPECGWSFGEAEADLSPE